MSKHNSSILLDRDNRNRMLRLFRMFAPHLRPHRKQMLSAWVCMLGATAMYLLQPWPVKIIFDYILMPQGEVELPAILQGMSLSAMMGWIAAAVLVVALLRGLFGYGQAYLTASVGQRVIASIRTRLFAHVQRLSRSFHDENHSGDLLLRLTGDIQLLRDLLVNSMLMVSERSLVMIAVAGVMLWMDWQLALVALTVLPALMLISFRVSGQIKQATRRQRRKESKTANILSETISSVDVIQAHAREDWEDERFARQHGASLQAGLRATRLEANLSRVVEVILAAGTAGVLWFGVQRVLAGALTPGDLLVFTAYLSTFYKPVRKLAALTSRMAKSSVCGERLLNILETEPEIRDALNARPAPALQGKITFRHVGFSYRNGKPVLRNSSFNIEPGQTVAVVGESGAGKSTIARLLLRFYDPQVGEILIDDTNIRNYTLDSLRRQIAIVLQEPHLFALSIRDNIAYGKPDATQEEIERAARMACADNFIRALPDGYGTILTERGASLSAGQRQRIAIARAMIRDTPIVILDEPMTGLDHSSEAEVQQALDRLTHGRTCLLVTHDIQAAHRCKQMLILKGNRILTAYNNPEMVSGSIIKTTAVPQGDLS
ncbi:MAG: ABC transporter ATP-binding protein [Thiolinea sp.]